jgi:trehalose dimycolate hydrolase
VGSVSPIHVKPHVSGTAAVHPQADEFRSSLVAGTIFGVSSHRIGRWVGPGVSAVLTTAGLLLSPTATPVASAFDCPDAEVIFARGTNEPPGLGRVGDAFVDSLRQQTGLNILPYGVNYAASKLQLHGGDGANDTIDRVKKSVETCPNTKIVLGGYSQGASVMDIVAGVPIGGINWGNTLPPQYANNIVAVATFGDVADRAGGTLPSQSALLGSKAIDLCNPQDPICHAGQGNEWSGHTEGYVPLYTTQAATFVASKLMAGSNQYGPGYGPQTPGSVPSVPGPSAPGNVPAPNAPNTPNTPATPNPQAPLV